MGLFDAWKKRKQKKKRSVIKIEDKEMEVGKKVAVTAKTAIQKRREAEAKLLKELEDG